MSKSTTKTGLASGYSGRDDYDKKFVENINRQASWLAAGASNKAESVKLLIEKNDIQLDNLLELGCGTGAVLQEAEKLNLSESFFGLDFSEEAINFLSSTTDTIHTAIGDITLPITQFDISQFDLVLISHTLEHLEDPQVALRAIKSLDFEYLLAEVPLENLLGGKFKSLFVDRSINSAGHVQFYDRATFRKLLRSCGYKILDDRLYAPVLSRQHIRTYYAQHGRFKHGRKYLTEHLLPRISMPFWKRLYHAHYALLCVKE